MGRGRTHAIGAAWEVVPRHRSEAPSPVFAFGCPADIAPSPMDWVADTRTASEALAPDQVTAPHDCSVPAADADIFLSLRFGSVSRGGPPQKKILIFLWPHALKGRGNV